MNHPFDQHGNLFGPSGKDSTPSTYKVKLALHDDSTVELYASEIEQISQEMGDIRNIYDICGIHSLFGPRYCPKCKANSDLDGCGRHFVAATQVDEPGLIEVQLKDGRVLYAKDYERVSDMEERPVYTIGGWPDLNESALGGLLTTTNPWPEMKTLTEHFAKQDDYTFIITTPDSDRTPYKAAYCELDGGCLILQDDNRETIMAWAAGHWVKVERVEDSEDDQDA